MAELKKSTRVGILTTKSLVDVQRLETELSSSKSVMCIDRASVETGVSRAYNAFVRPGTGILGKISGGRSFRADVSDDITEGDSWQLGMYLAHALRGEEQLATGDRNHRYWIVTGIVNADLEVLGVDGFAQKIAVLEAWLAENHSDFSSIEFFLPEANLTKSLSDVLDKIRGQYSKFKFIPIAAVDGAISRQTSPAPLNRYLRGWPALAVGGVAVAMAILGGVAIGWDRSDGSDDVTALDDLIEVQSTSEPLDTTQVVADEPNIVEPAREVPADKPAMPQVVSAQTIIVETSSTQNSCYATRSSLETHQVKAGDSLTLPAAQNWCDFAIQSAGVGGSAQRRRTFLVGYNGIETTPQALGTNGSLIPWLSPDVQKVELVFSEKMLNGDDQTGDLPRVQILFEN